MIVRNEANKNKITAIEVIYDIIAPEIKQWILISIKPGGKRKSMKVKGRNIEKYVKEVNGL